MSATGKFTGVKYVHDCGFFAVYNGRIICPEQGISGQKIDADIALASAMAWDGIDWHAVERIPWYESVSNEPGYFESIPF